MKTVLFLIKCMLIAQCTMAQVVTVEYLLSKPAAKVEQYKSAPHGGNKYRLPFQYKSNTLFNTETLRRIEREGPCRVDFVYPRYAETNGKNLKELNTLRLRALMGYSSFLFFNSAIEWNVYEVPQEPVNAADTMERVVDDSPFVGFVIYTRPMFLMKDKQYVATDVRPNSWTEAQWLYQDLKQYQCFLDNDKKRRIKRKRGNLEWDGKYLPKSNRKLQNGVRYNHKGIWNRDKEYTTPVFSDTLYRTSFKSDSTCACLKEKYITLKLIPMKNGKKLEYDTIVSAVLNRNNQWKRLMIVTDVTSGMSPYTLHMLQWRKMVDKGHRARQFVFFNDGDNIPDGAMGASGGVYHVSSGDSRNVELRCLQAMQNGSGGAAPENDVEAILYAEKKMKPETELVLIADNWAPVRDFQLLGNIKNPVHIILTGSNGGTINSDFLNIAYKSKGSLHTMNQDITELHELRNGDIVEVGKQTFILKNGWFTLAR
jgi:hypothetical protein